MTFWRILSRRWLTFDFSLPRSHPGPSHGEGRSSGRSSASLFPLTSRKGRRGLSRTLSCHSLFQITYMSLKMINSSNSLLPSPLAGEGPGERDSLPAPDESPPARLSHPARLHDSRIATLETPDRSTIDPARHHEHSPDADYHPPPQSAAHQSGRNPQCICPVAVVCGISDH